VTGDFPAATIPAWLRPPFFLGSYLGDRPPAEDGDDPAATGRLALASSGPFVPVAARSLRARPVAARAVPLRPRLLRGCKKASNIQSDVRPLARRLHERSSQNL
jgi:hypothetical protein